MIRRWQRVSRPGSVFIVSVSGVTRLQSAVWVLSGRCVMRILADPATSARWNWHSYIQRLCRSENQTTRGYTTNVTKMFHLPSASLESQIRFLPAVQDHKLQLSNDWSRDNCQFSTFIWHTLAIRVNSVPPCCCWLHHDNSRRNEAAIELCRNHEPYIVIGEEGAQAWLDITK